MNCAGIGMSGEAGLYFPGDKYSHAHKLGTCFGVDLSDSLTDWPTGIKVAIIVNL